MAKRAAFLFVIGLAIGNALRAASGTPAWLQTYAPAVSGTGDQDPQALRVLADGTALLVAKDKSGLAAVRYDAATGAVLASAFFTPPFAVVRVAISAFGDVFVLSQGATHAGDFWTMKYDGATGRPAWPAPAVFDGAGSNTDVPIAIATDGAGDVFVTGAAHNGTDYDWATLKYAGESGVLLWGPVLMGRPGSAADNPAFLGVDAAGDVVVTGFSQAGATPYDWVTAKYSGATGATVWGPVVFDGPDHGSDFPDALAFDGAGNVIVSGEVGTASGGTDWATVEYDKATGAVRWGPVLFSGAGGGDDKPAAVAADGRGDVVVSGRTWTGSSFDWATVKYSGAGGAVLWGPVTFSLSSTSQDYPLRVGVDGAGGVVVTGYSFRSNYDWVTLKYDGATGAVAWGPVVYHETLFFDDFTRDLALDASGNVLVTGMSQNGQNEDAVTVKYAAANGAVLWGPAIFQGTGLGAALDPRLASDGAGNVFAAGTQAGLTSGASDLDWFVAKYDGATGSVLWGPARFDGPTHQEDRVVALAVDASGNLTVTGSTSHTGNVDWATIKYDGSTGAILWGPVLFDGGGGSADTPVALAVDGAGDIVVTGNSSGGSLAGSPTVKYSGSTGAVVWGPILFDGTTEALGLSSNGDAFVTGSHFNGSDTDWATVKYKAADGSLLWGPVAFAGSRNGSGDAPTALAVDGSGNLLVTGIESGPGSAADFDWATLKYDGATGSVLWGPKTFGGASGARDVPAAVRADASGNVFVTGTVINPPTGPATMAPDFDNVNIGWATFKYDGATGATLWGPIEFDGAAHLDDRPAALALDASGNAVVAGYSTGLSGTFDMTVLKYRSADGLALWSAATYDSGGWDQAVGLATIGNDAVLTGPSGSTVATLRLTEALAIGNLALPSAACGESYAASLTASNGTPPYSWSLASGSLPGGLTLSPGSGQIAGTPIGEGSFAFHVDVTDAASATVGRDFTIDVYPAAGVPILASADPVCPGAPVTLSVAGSFASYLWFPGGEMTPTISVSPTNPATYGVVVTDGSGCTHEGSLTLSTAIADPPSPLVTVAACVPAATPGLAASTPAHTCSTYAWTISGGTIDSGQGTAAITFTSGPAGTLATLEVLETSSTGASASASAAIQADFADVPPANPFHDAVCTIARNRITAGCGGGNYCPTSTVTRAQMAVFLLKAEHGPDHVPPPCTGVFADVPCPAGFAVDWIEELYAEAITGGCGGGNYCPGSPVTRAQMAVFLLKTLLGASYVPPVVGQIFDDVPPGSFAADWINDLYGRAITGGCSASPLLYCPSNPNTRGQMAVFLTRTFELP